MPAEMVLSSMLFDRFDGAFCLDDLPRPSVFAKAPTAPRTDHRLAQTEDPTLTP